MFVIKKSSFIKSDPWLISAEIAYSSILNRYSKLVKSGVEYLNRNNSNPYSITELASALGTLEFNNGNLKEARKYFKCSLINPNDNSLAQASWMSEGLSGVLIESSKYDLPYAFEANALKQYEQKSYQESFNTAILWQNDEPYSTRPIRLASYIASTFLKNNSAAIKLIEKGLSINPNDLTLLNNLVYNLAKEDQIEKALKIFEGTLKKHLPVELDKNRIAITATAGLLCYKKNLPEEGKSLYLKAIELAKKLKNEYYLSLATANYLREEIRFVSKKEDLNKYDSELDDLAKNTKEPDVLMLINEAKLELYKVNNSLS